jgi:hypothetical protein
MKPVSLFNPGDRVRIKSGILSGTVAQVIDAFQPQQPGMSWDHYWLTIQARALDGSKVIVQLDSAEVELITDSSDS